MKWILILFCFLFAIHVVVLVLFNQFRIYKIMKYCKKFKNDGTLNERDFDFLEDRYRSFLGYLEGFPDVDDFAVLYLNSDFDSLRKRYNLLIRYLIISVLMTTSILIVLAAFGVHKL